MTQEEVDKLAFEAEVRLTFARLALKDQQALNGMKPMILRREANRRWWLRRYAAERSFQSNISRVRQIHEQVKGAIEHG